MRKNTQAVLEAWLQVRRGGNPGSAIWTERGTIWSYATTLLTYDPNTDAVVLNRTRYSRTTSAHQNAIAAFLDERGIEYREVDGLPRGAAPAHLRAAANPPGAYLVSDAPYPVTWTGLGVA